jgi:hypothetical protein
MRELPVFKGYTVDERLQEFRKMFPMEFIPFDSEKGKKLLAEMETENVRRKSRI